MSQPARSIFLAARNRARDKSLPFSITLEYVRSMYDAAIADGYCTVLGIPLERGNVPSPNTPSIDRIIPSLGYVPGNVRIISLRANTLKSNATLSEMKLIVEDLSKIDYDKILSYSEPPTILTVSAPTKTKRTKSRTKKSKRVSVKATDFDAYNRTLPNGTIITSIVRT